MDIEDPLREPVYLKCTDPNYSDPTLSKWLPVDATREDYAKLASPQVVKTQSESVISCLFDTIKEDTKTIDCPYFPFRMPIIIPYNN